METQANLHHERLLPRSPHPNCKVLSPSRIFETPHRGCEYISIYDLMNEMALGKRKFTPARSKKSYVKRYKRAKKAGRTGYANIMRVASQVRALTRTIETKEGCYRLVNSQLAHNNVTILNDNNGNPLNPFRSTLNTGDPMGANDMQRIGDQISVKGVLFKFFVEGSLNRSKVYFRFMLVRCAKGDTPNRDNLFKGAATNKMIDQINRERFSIIAQKIFNVQPPQAAPGGITVSGTPATTAPAGTTGNRMFSMWVPGRKFGRQGTLQFENASTSQVKFYDYRMCVVAYDWYGTPQDVNNVGFINEGFCKTYFKDA